ncbi:MAG: PAC2 family protein [Candidatus Anammoximicrobium sp.]|nr:PAC2 family protein [Candidatus Anammoximicrobium sp.]
MMESGSHLIRLCDCPELNEATLVLAFTGWMDGGDVSTGTVKRLVHLLDATPVASIDPEAFYLYNVPGSMEIASLFRPHVEISDGLIKSVNMPENEFYVHSPANLVLFIGKEPNLRWRTFGECVLQFASQAGVRRILFIGSFGGSVPHTREPRLFITCSDPELRPEMERYGLRRTDYVGPGSFTNYLMTLARPIGLQMVSLVAEIPSYLQGANPLSIEAVTRRLAKILKLPLDLASLRSASTAWELEVSSAVDQNEELTQLVRRLEDEYDNQLLEQADEH